jgi:hypothetical protein
VLAHPVTTGRLIGQMVVPPDQGVRSHPEARADRQGNSPTEARSRSSLGIMPHRGIAGRAFLKLVDRQRINATSADIRGPELTLYFGLRATLSQLTPNFWSPRLC